MSYRDCPDCAAEMSAHEYGYDSPNRYDGISEWVCPKCGLRIGRWSGKRLEEGEEEPRWGGITERTSFPWRL